MVSQTAAAGYSMRSNRGYLRIMSGFRANGATGRFARLIGLGAGCLALANCSAGSKVDSKYGVSASERVVAAGQPVPKGGGVYRVGRPYTVAGRTYFPEENTSYNATGIASWYGDDFHGRFTSNGEIYDKNSISAAHKTLPLPSYVRVTSLANKRSIVVRVNDRGPFAQDREIDLSYKTAQLLGFHGRGLAKVKVEYVGRAPINGSDDRKLLATLREGDKPAIAATMLADNSAPVRRAAASKAAPVEDVVEEEQAPQAPVRVAAADTGFTPAFFDSRPLASSKSISDDNSAPKLMPRAPTTELAANTRLRAPVMAAPLAPAEPAVSPVSAYAPTRYDRQPSGFMSGRGLY
jgi:rare lipoprotein A